MTSTVIGADSSTDEAVETISQDSLVMAELPLVRLLLDKLLVRLPHSVEAEDLFSAGLIALVEAARRFDAHRGIRFRTYAEPRVRGAMLDYLRTLSWAPRGLRRVEREIDSARSAVENRIARRATIAELAVEMGIDPDRCNRMLAKINAVELIEWDALTDRDARHSSSQSYANDPVTMLERKEKLQLVQRAIENLPERLRLVLWLYYYEELKLKQVGAVLDVNEARASQLHSKAISALRGELSRVISCNTRVAGENRLKERGSKGSENGFSKNERFDLQVTRR
jgi:RNA polymerase sigma factor FliA